MGRSSTQSDQPVRAGAGCDRRLIPAHERRYSDVVSGGPSTALWVVYVLISEPTGRTYVGITSDLARRLAQHNGEEPGGAKATRAGRPWVTGASYGPFTTRGDALRAERAVKKLRGHRRLTWRAPP
ncbi:MAG: GIY-YIG nuclease family protein [Proteobacteria bacterium]|nr:GIY-YIG nuclease family protein [Pseudomonadota bacterium]